MSTPASTQAAETPEKPKQQQRPVCRTFKQILAEWVYGVDQDFKSPEGVPARWAPGQPKQWGDESKKIDINSAKKPTSISADPSGSLIAVAVGLNIYIYSLATSELVETLSGHGERVTRVAFCPKPTSVQDDKEEIVLVSSSWAREDGTDTIIVWKLDVSGKDLNPPSPQPDLDILTTAATDAVMGQLLEHGWAEGEQALSNMVAGIRQSIAAATLTHTRFDRTILKGSFFSFGSPVFSHDGSRLLFHTKNHSTQSGDRPALDLPCVNIYNIREGSVERQLRGHTDAIMWAAFSPNSKLIASVAWDGTVGIWDAATGETKHTLGPFGGQMWAGTFSPDSTHIAFSVGSPKTIVFVFNLETGVEVARMHDIQHWARSFDWSPGGSLLAAGGDSGQLSVWDPYTGTEKQKWHLSNEGNFHGMHVIGVSDVQFVDEGRKLVFTTSDGSIQAYDFSSNEKYHIEPGEAASNGPVCICWVPSLRSLVSANKDAALRFWPLQEASTSAPTLSQ